MAKYDKYKKYRRLISLDGENWILLDEYGYYLSDDNSVDCGSYKTKTEYTETTECSGTTKWYYYSVIIQESYDGGETWTTIQTLPEVAFYEKYSDDCGYERKCETYYETSDGYTGYTKANPLAPLTFPEDTNFVIIGSCVSAITGDDAWNGYIHCIYNMFYYGRSDLAPNAISEITIPNNIVEIGKYTFYEINKLSSIVVPDSVITIGDCAFAFCGLNRIVIGSGVENLALNAFVGNNPTYMIYKNDKLERIPDMGNWTNLATLVLPTSLVYFPSIPNKPWTANITIPDTVKYINDNAFYENEYIKLISLPDNLETIGSYAFSRSTLESLYVPSKASIGFRAFQYCENLKNVYITNGDANRTIGEDAFDGCSSLTSVTIGEGIETIKANAFSNCDNLEIIKLPNSLKNVESFGAAGSVRVKDGFGENIEVIADGAFYGGRGLSNIVFSTALKSIGSNAFMYSDIGNTITYKGTREQFPMGKKGYWRRLSPGINIRYVKCTDGTLDFGEDL